MKKLFVALLLVYSASYPSWSEETQGINGAGNAGDHCEQRYQDVRRDLISWIVKKGPVDLKFPSDDWNAKRYSEEMLLKMKESVFECNNKKIEYLGIDKTCRNYQEGPGLPHIIHCNIDRLMGASEDQQYKLIHHEWAGTIGLETNDGTPESNYFVSNQITTYLEEFRVKKLVVKSINSIRGSKNEIVQGDFNREPLDQCLEAFSKNEKIERYLKEDPLVIKDSHLIEVVEFTVRPLWSGAFRVRGTHEYRRNPKAPYIEELRRSGPVRVGLIENGNYIFDRGLSTRDFEFELLVKLQRSTFRCSVASNRKTRSERAQNIEILEVKRL